MLPETHPEGSRFASLHLLPEAAAGKDRGQEHRAEQWHMAGDCTQA